MTKIVRILNITPDSFFDGGRYNQKENALKQLEILLANNVDVIDVGAESTRPDAITIDAEEEIKRLQDILPQIIAEVQKHNLDPRWILPRAATRGGDDKRRDDNPQKNHKKVEISLDSRHSKTVAWALDLGIDVINDVSGFVDLGMINLAAKSGKKIVVMHNLGVPADKNKIVDENLDVVQVVIDWMENKLQQLLKAGVKKSQIIFDVGIGFGKNAFQSIKLLQEIDRLRVLDLPLYIGHSNKSFLDQCVIEYGEAINLNEKWILRYVQDDKIREETTKKEIAREDKTREEKTILVSKYLIEKNVEYLRVHNALNNVAAIKSSAKN